MNPIARIIDANFNRAREALRVMEDAARFALDDAELVQLLKDLRHELRGAVEALPGIDRGHLLASRDTPGDIGTAISTPNERLRAGLPDIIAAAAGRLSEALRTLEEAAKAAGHGDSAFERFRYRSYDAERRLGLALGARRAPQWRLCVLLTASLCTHHPWESVADAAIRAGADAIQLREKDLDGCELLGRARRLIDIARSHSRHTAIIINDRPDVAVLARADGIHLGQMDLPVQEVRRIAGFTMAIGLSTTNLDQAREAIRQGADYCGIGPMFPTTTKDKAQISGPAYLREYLADPVLSAIPHLAIGGINPENVGELWEAGCGGIAVSSAICCAPDPEAVCRQLRLGEKLPDRT